MYFDATMLEMKVHEHLVSRGAVSCCLTCGYFDEETEVCKEAGQRPPARVIVFGCPKWDDIPF